MTSHRSTRDWHPCLNRRCPQKNFTLGKKAKLCPACKKEEDAKTKEAWLDRIRAGRCETTGEKREAIRQACLKAKFPDSAPLVRRGWSPSLADVLLAAIPIIELMHPHDLHHAAHAKEAVIDWWLLTNDSLDYQSSETIDFLYSLLCR